MKKQLLLFMILLPMMASAYDAKIDDIYYIFNNTDKTATVTYLYKDNSNVHAYSGEVKIPSEVTYNDITYKITSIGDYAFYFCSNLTSVIIPNSVISIGKYAFYYSFVGSVSIGNSVTTISDYAFSNSGLTSVTIPNSVTYIGYSAFSENPLKNVSIGNSVEYIGDLAFYWCSQLTSVIIPNSVTYIGESAFRYCHSLSSVYISDFAQWLSFHFQDIFPNAQFYIDDSNIAKMTKAVIPDGVTEIRERAFANFVYLTSVTIPQSVTSIGNSAFEGCVSLTTLAIPDGVPAIPERAFYGCSYLTSVNIPISVTSIGEYAFGGCKSLASVSIPPSLTFIGEEAFQGCSSLTSVNITDIAAWCNINFKNGYESNPLYCAHHLFVNETEITDLDIPNGVTSIGDYAFIGCSSLNSITIPNSVTYIGNQVFVYCSGLTTITIPNSVNYIGEGAFMFCSSLTGIVIPNSVISIGDNAFQNCSGLASITIGNGVTSIGHYLFSNCNSLTSITIPNSVASIEPGAFYFCENLTSVTIPNSVTSIGSGAFFYCKNLTSIVIPNSVTSIGASAFEYCAALKTINIPENLQIIWNNTFNYCLSLKSVLIPSSVEFIYQEAFANCNSLEKIIALPTNPPFLYDNSFSNFSIPLKVPNGYKEAYQSAQGWKNFTNISDADKYKLTYVVDGEEYKIYEIEEGETITPEPAPTKEGYTFSGWSKIPETMPAHDVTVTGTFTKGEYKLTYYVDGVVYKTDSYDYGATITPEAEPTKEGYTFSGWSEIPETMPAHDVTVTGTFSINKYKLTYTVDGTEYKSYEVEYGAAITAEAEPTKEGYTFSGWSEIPSTMPPYDVTVTGSFNINSYKLTYMIDDKVYKEMMYEYGATIIPEPQPEGDYATFEWTNLPQTMPAHDVVVYASYTSGIIEVLMASQHNVRIYSTNGKKLNKLQKGLNLVVFDDGTVKKAILK